MSDFVIFNLQVNDSVAQKQNFSNPLIMGEFAYDSATVLKTGKYFTSDYLVGGDQVRVLKFTTLAGVAEIFLATSKIYKEAIKVFSQPITPENVYVGLVKTSDTTRAVALDAILEENSGWYTILDVGDAATGGADTDATEFEEIADWTEANKKFYIAVTDDASVKGSTTNNANDIASIAKANNYTRTEVIYVNSYDTDGDLQRQDGALAGYWGALRPGSETQKFLRLAGITAVDSEALALGVKLNATNIENILDKNANVFYSSLVGDIYKEGTTAYGRYADVVRYADYLKQEMEVELSLALANPANGNKVSYTDSGVAILKSTIQHVLQRELNAERLSEFTTYDKQGKEISVPYVIESIAVADVSTNDRNSRQYSGFTVKVRYSSAIHKVTIDGTMEV